MPEVTKNPAATATANSKKKQEDELAELAKRIEKKETKAEKKRIAAAKAKAEEEQCVYYCKICIVIFFLAGFAAVALICQDNSTCTAIYATTIIAIEAVVNFEHGAAARHEAEVAAGVAGVGAVQLTASNFDSKIAGKGAFIKFLAPW